MILYRTSDGFVVEEAGKYYRVDSDAPKINFDALIAHDDLYRYLLSIIATGVTVDRFESKNLLAPIGHQEVWASGVTYYRSRGARMEEAKEAGGGDFYDRVYSAERPELFFKAIAHKVAGPNDKVRIRKDATWSVPEPELALLVNPRAEIIGYTIGNDMSSRDIEGLNPLYLPQAKVYDQSCALGPGVLIQKEVLPSTTSIQMEIIRAQKVAYSAAITLADLKRRPQTLVEYLFRDHSFPFGCFLLTGTGIVPPNSFALMSGDVIRIAIGGIGELVNTVA